MLRKLIWMVDTYLQLLSWETADVDSFPRPPLITFVYLIRHNGRTVVVIVIINFC